MSPKFIKEYYKLTINTTFYKYSKACGESPQIPLKKCYILRLVAVGETL